MASRMNDATLARFLSGEASPQEQVEVRRWLGSHPDRQRELERLETAWRLSAARSAPEFDIEAMRHRLRSRASDPRHSMPGYAFAPRRAWPIPMAVAGVVAAGAAFLFMAARAQRPERSLAPVVLEWREVTTDRSQRADVYLSDGTRVLLAPESRLRFTSPLADSVRDVVLEGHALFDVKHDSLRPFRVRTTGGVAEDLGTRFDVKQYAGDTVLKVVVAEGLVALSGTDRNGQVTLRPGDLGTLGPSGRVAVRHGVDVAREIAWATGRLSFEAVPLRDAIRELRRYYELEFVIASSEAGARRLTASFSSEPPSEVVRVISLSLDLNYRIRGKTVVFTPRETQ